MTLSSVALSAGLALLLLLIAATALLLCFSLCRASGKWKEKDDKEQSDWLKEWRQHTNDRFR